ncbi:MAG TPA: glycosyltransferase, partial [Chitinophagaceae bacterium]
CIAGCKHDITFTIIGAIEDVAYWNKCSGIINSFAENIKVNMLEAQPVPRIQQVMNDHHLFVLPTRGENFGHAIFESLAAGRPVLISDQTPWRDLTRHKAGWDLPLDAPARFKEVVEEVTAMNREQLKEWCCGAKDYCKNYLETSGIKEQYLKLFS